MNNEDNNMQWTIDDIIKSLMSDWHDDENPIIPDGLIDLSYLFLPLRKVCAQGRLLISNEMHEIGRFIAEFFSVLSKDRNESQLQMMVVVALLLRESTNLSDDMSLEEILMRALEPARWDRVIEEFKAVPVITDETGRQRPNVACLPIFYMRKQITLDMMKGFSRRWLRPTLPSLFLDAIESAQQDVRPAQQPSEPDFVVVDVDEAKEYDADPLEGFDEFYEFFLATDAAAYEQGYDIDDLDNVDLVDEQDSPPTEDEAQKKPIDQVPPDDENPTNDTGLY